MQPEELENLLRRLDDGRERAREKYEDIRRMLIKYFAWNNCYPAEDCARTVIERVAARLMTEDIQDIHSLIRDVAKDVQRGFLCPPPPPGIEDPPHARGPQSEDKKDKAALRPDEFESLLRRLGDDRELAGERYEDIRRMLMKYFAWNNCYPKEEHADTVIDRVAARLMKEDIQNIDAFIRGVAKNVRRESYRRPRPTPIEDVPPRKLPQSENAEQTIINRSEEQRRQQCLDTCIQKLTDSDRKILIEYEYYAAKAQAAQQLAARLNLKIPALRTKAHRIREKIEACVRNCFNGLKVNHAI